MFTQFIPPPHATGAESSNGSCALMSCLKHAIYILPFLFQSLQQRDCGPSIHSHSSAGHITRHRWQREHLWIFRSLQSLHTFPTLAANRNLRMELSTKTKQTTASNGWIIYISSILYLAIASVPCTPVCVVSGLGGSWPCPECISPCGHFVFSTM